MVHKLVWLWKQNRFAVHLSINSGTPSSGPYSFRNTSTAVNRCAALGPGTTCQLRNLALLGAGLDLQKCLSAQAPLFLQGL